MDVSGSVRRLGTWPINKSSSADDVDRALEQIEAGGPKTTQSSATGSTVQPKPHSNVSMIDMSFGRKRTKDSAGIIF
jgi:hypothetical protein